MYRELLIKLLVDFGSILVSVMDLRQYLQRIQYDGPLNTKATTLNEICRCHSQNIPFEFFDMFGGSKKILSIEKIFNDMVVNKRGGFCCEHSTLFWWALKKIGFKVDILQSQVYMTATDTFDPKFGHMCLMVNIVVEEL